MSASKKPVMDVSKPGETPADATSRPIISGHAVLKDPMVNATDADTEAPIDALAESDESPKEVAAPSVAHKVIKPLEPETETADPDKKKEPEDEHKPDSEVSDGAVVDAVLDQVTDKKKQEIVDAEEIKRQELVNKLVEEKKYFVPIGQVRSRRNNRLILVALAALLPLVVGLGVAADAGSINLGFKPPFDFIKDKPAASTQAPVTTTNTTNSQPTPTQKVLTYEEFNKSRTGRTQTTLVSANKTPDLTKYSNEELGISFFYPKVWGSVSLGDCQRVAVDSVKPGNFCRLVAFSGEKYVEAAFSTKDYTQRDTANDGLPPYPIASYDAMVAEPPEAGVKKISSSSSFEIVEYAPVQPINYIYLDLKLSQPKINAIEFVFGLNMSDSNYAAMRSVAISQLQKIALQK